MHIIKFNDIWEQKLLPLLIVRGWKYRRGGENIVMIFSPRGEDIVGVKISSHTGSNAPLSTTCPSMYDNETAAIAAADPVNCLVQLKPKQHYEENRIRGYQLSWERMFRQ